MPFISKSFISRLLEKVDIVDVISSRVKLKRSGGNTFMACCPFHSEKTPSFSVHQGKQFYNCFGCHKAGNAINFIMEYDHVTYPEAVEIIASIAGVEVEYENNGNFNPEDKVKTQNYYSLMESAVRFYEQELYRNSKALDYLEHRGLSRTTVEKYHIGFAPDDWNFLKSRLNPQNNIDLQNSLVEIGLLNLSDGGKSYDTFRNRLIIPIRDKRGRTIGLGGRVLDNSKPKYINSKESTIYKKGWELFNLDYVRKLRTEDFSYILVTEGYMDVIALDQYGFHNAVASLGTATTTEQIELLLKQTDHIKFCYDGDDAGRHAAWRVLENSLGVVEDDKVFSFCFLPKEHDPDTFVRTFGADSLRVEFDNALSLIDYIISELNAKYNVYERSGQIGCINEASYIYMRMNNRASVTRETFKLAVSALVNCPIDQLDAIFKAKMNSNGYPNQGDNYHNNLSPNNLPKIKDPTNFQWLIRQLFVHPDYFRYIQNPDMLVGILQKYSNKRVEILGQVLGILQRNPEIKSGVMLEEFSDNQKIYNFIRQLLSIEETSLNEIYEVNVGDFIRLIRQVILDVLSEKKRDYIAKSTKPEGLTPEELAEFEFLTKKSKELNF